MAAIASKQFKAGDVISNCKPLFLCVEEEFKGSHCDNCLKRSILLKSCAKCLGMHYCDKSCQINDWKYHKNECKIYERFSMGSRPVFERILLRVWLCLESDPEFATQRHQLVDGSDICLNEIEVDDKQMKELLKEDFAERIGFELICCHFVDYGLKFVPKELLHWYAMIGLPFVHPIKYYTDNPFLLFQSSNIPIAYGLYIQISTVSHSCLPNTGFVSNGSSLQIRAVKSIDSGKQLTSAFVGLSQKKSERQQDLRLKLLKECECDKCRLNLDEDFDYKRFDVLLSHHMSQWMPMGCLWVNYSLSKDYWIDPQMVVSLRLIYGEFDPNSSELIALSFICFAIYSEHCNPLVLTLWYQKISQIVEVSHGRAHPLFKLITDVFGAKILIQTSNQ